jgi:hypothetical protein
LVIIGSILWSLINISLLARIHDRLNRIGLGFTNDLIEHITFLGLAGELQYQICGDPM